jgi:hypothetical protein
VNAAGQDDIAAYPMSGSVLYAQRLHWLLHCRPHVTSVSLHPSTQLSFAPHCMAHVLYRSAHWFEQTLTHVSGRPNWAMRVMFAA